MVKECITCPTSALLHSWMTCPISTPYYYWMKKIKLVESFYQIKNIKWIGWLIFQNLFSETSTIRVPRFSVNLTLTDTTTVINLSGSCKSSIPHIIFPVSFIKPYPANVFTQTLFFLLFFFKDTCWYNYINWIPTTLWFSGLPPDKYVRCISTLVKGWMRCPHLGRSL